MRTITVIVQRICGQIHETTQHVGSHRTDPFRGQMLWGLCMCMYVGGGEGSVVQIFVVVLITTVTLMTEHRHSGSDVFPLSGIYCNAFDPAFKLTGPWLRQIFLCDLSCISRKIIFREVAIKLWWWWWRLWWWLSGLWWWLQSSSHCADKTLRQLQMIKVLSV